MRINVEVSADSKAAIQNLKNLSNELTEKVFLAAVERASDQIVPKVHGMFANSELRVRPPKPSTQARKIRKRSPFPFTSLVEFQHYAQSWDSYVEPQGKNAIRAVLTPVGSHPNASLSMLQLGQILDMGTRKAVPRRHFEKLRKLFRDAILKEIREEIERVVSRY